mmetsp:Transcript_15685/g.40604  ORF Transcript_15685/g.40604 Transcript_15685/m.40604 type:complete len:93 (+) Transcript_15685:1711-1989(+)
MRDVEGCAIDTIKITGYRFVILVFGQWHVMPTQIFGEFNEGNLPIVLNLAGFPATAPAVRELLAEIHPLEVFACVKHLPEFVLALPFLNDRH